MTLFRQAIVRERRTKFIFFAAVILGLLAVLILVKNLLASFVLAFVIYYLLVPFVDHLERRGFSRALSTTIPFVILIGLATIGGVLWAPTLIEQISSLLSQAPQYVESFNQLIVKWQIRAEDFSQSMGMPGMNSVLLPKLSQWTTDNLQRLPTLLQESLTVILLAPFLAFFMLVDGRVFIRNILNLVPNSLFELILDLNHQIGSQIGGFIRARLLEGLLVGVVVWIGLMCAGFPYAMILALCAALLNVIPYLGPLLGAAPAFVIALSGPAQTSDYLILLGIYGVAQAIDAAILVPFLVAKIVNLHPVTVVLAVLIGSQLMGIIGMIICIPVVSALKVTSIAIYRHLTHFRD